MLRFKVIKSFGLFRALSALLAAGLLLCELLAADGPFHQALHTGKAASNSCLLCLFAKGQVDSPVQNAIITAPVPTAFDSSPRLETVVLADFRYLVSPSRAPPAFASASPVVG